MNILYLLVRGVQFFVLMWLIAQLEHFNYFSMHSHHGEYRLDAVAAGFAFGYLSQAVVQYFARKTANPRGNWNVMNANGTFVLIALICWTGFAYLGDAYDRDITIYTFFVCCFVMGVVTCNVLVRLTKKINWYLQPA